MRAWPGQCLRSSVMVSGGVTASCVNQRSLRTRGARGNDEVYSTCPDDSLGRSCSPGGTCVGVTTCYPACWRQVHWTLKYPQLFLRPCSDQHRSPSDSNWIDLGMAC